MDKQEQAKAHEGETVIFTDAKGNPVSSAKEAHMVEVEHPDGTHTILTKKPGDPFAR